MPNEDSIQSLLNRPDSDRLREHKYRFAQCLIFGLPVLALQLFGPMLGGTESSRWIGLLQLLLAGWVAYIGAVPMLIEGMMWLGNRKLKIELLVAGVALLLYGFGVAGWILALRGQRSPFSTAFSIEVLLLIIWSAAHWTLLTRRVSHSGGAYLR